MEGEGQTRSERGVGAWLSALLDPWDERDLDVAGPVTAARMLHRVDLAGYQGLCDREPSLPSLAGGEPDGDPESLYLSALISRLKGHLSEAAAQWRSLVENPSSPAGVRLAAGVRAAGTYRLLLDDTEREASLDALETSLEQQETDGTRTVQAFVTLQRAALQWDRFEMSGHSTLLQQARTLLVAEEDPSSRVWALLWYRAHKTWPHGEDRPPLPPEPPASVTGRALAPVGRILEDQFLRAFEQPPRGRLWDPMERHLTARVLWSEAVGAPEDLNASCAALGHHWLTRSQHDETPPGEEDLGLLLSAGVDDSVLLVGRHLRLAGPIDPLMAWGDLAPTRRWYPHAGPALLALVRQAADVMSSATVGPCVELLLSRESGMESAHRWSDLQRERAAALASLLPRLPASDHERIASWAIESHEPDDVLAWDALSTLAGALDWRHMAAVTAESWRARSNDALAARSRGAMNSNALLVVRALHLGGNAHAGELISAAFDDQHTTARAWLVASTASRGARDALAVLRDAAADVVRSPPNSAGSVGAYLFEPNPIVALADVLVRPGNDDHEGWEVLVSAIGSDLSSGLLVEALWIVAARPKELPSGAVHRLVSAAHGLLHGRGHLDIAAPAALALASMREPLEETGVWIASWLGSPDPAGRRAGIDVLGLARPVAEDLAEALLLPCLGDRDVRVRAAALEVLCSGPDLSGAARPLVLGAMGAPGSALLAAALRGLTQASARLRQDLLGDALLQAETHDSFEVRQLAAQALATAAQRS